MFKRFWMYLVSGMASALGAVIITKASNALDQSDVKDRLKNKFNNLKNRVRKKKDEP